mgnify:CR=1 FL=1
MQAITNKKQKWSSISDQYKADIIQNYFKTAANTEYRNLKFTELELLDVLYLTAFIRCAKNKDSGSVWNLNRRTKILPIDSIAIFNHLITKRLISISDEMPINSFIFDAHGKIIDFDPYSLDWLVHIEGGVPNNSNPDRLLLNKIEEMDTSYKQVVKGLWIKLIVDECIDNFLEKASQYNLSVHISNPMKLKKKLATIVEGHSLAQCFEMIHCVCESSRVYLDNAKIDDEKLMQQYLLTEFEKGIKNIEQYNVSQLILERYLEPQISTVTKLLFQEIFCIDSGDWFEYNLAENKLFAEG